MIHKLKLLNKLKTRLGEIQATIEQMEKEDDVWSDEFQNLIGERNGLKFAVDELTEVFNYL